MSGTARSTRFRIAVRRYAAFEQAITAQWADFNAHAQTGLTLEVVPLDLTPLEDALFASGGMARGDWDIAFVATDWIAAMARLGCAHDLAPRLAQDPPPDWPHGWTPSLLRLQTVGPQILGVPYHDGPECLIYRRDLFEDANHRVRFREQHNRELAPPRTWDEFHTIARFFHAGEPGLDGTAVAAFPDGHNTVYDFLLQLWTRGGELIAPDGTLRFDTPEAEAALTFYRTLVQDRTATSPDCATLDSVALGARFLEGKLAMMVNWFGFAAAAYTADDSRVRGRVNIAPIPHSDSSASVSLNVYWVLSIASGSPHADVAWRFLRHILTPAMDRLTTLSGAIGCRKSTWTDPEVNARIPFYSQMEALHAVAREIPQHEDWPAIAHTIDTLITRALTTDTPSQDLLREAQEAQSNFRSS